MLHFFLHILGIDTQQSYYYDFASGWGPKILELGVIVFLWYWHNQCHYHLCMRIGRYPLGHHKLCKRHHPDTPTRVTENYVKGLHKRLTK